MAKVMLAERNGKITFYVAKKDMEEVITKLEFDSDEKWGGEVELANGDVWFIEPAAKNIPSEVVARRISEK